jgi:predicted amidohydrolase
VTFSRIGYLHFGRNHEQPIESLRIELEENRNNVCNALVVLPEGFNIRKFYWDKAKSDAGSEVLDDLKRLSREYGAAFVVGLTIRFPNQPLYSSAYLIDEERPPEVICHKEHDDGSLNYRPCPHEECDTRNPIECRCCWIGAMICMDAGWAQTRDATTG